MLSRQKKKLFNIGYLIYLIGLAIAYFTVDLRNIYVPLFTLTFLFGVFNVYLFFKKEDAS